ncbi:MAG: hypothetical protein PHI06_14265 [Desulfobulbaceae bacterium]|nr:hypothetical protein [Desulfobulbaceae bacterium]
MQSSLYGDKKQLWQMLLCFFLITAFLLPSVHSHDIKHDDGQIHYDLTLKVAANHNHVTHHANFIDVSWHDHDSNQHVHVPENQLIRARPAAESTEKHKSFFSQALSCSLALTLKKVPSGISNQFSSITPPSHLEFIFIATDLPPPTV